MHDVHSEAPSHEYPDPEHVAQALLASSVAYLPAEQLEHFKKGALDVLPCRYTSDDNGQ